VWGVIFRTILGQVFSPKTGQVVSGKGGHSFSAKLVHDGDGETPPCQAYFWFSSEGGQEGTCLEKGRKPWISERC